MSLFSTLVAAACGVLGLAGTAYFTLSTWAALRYNSEPKLETSPSFSPPVSILKSLKGIDRHMYAAFASHVRD